MNNAVEIVLSLKDLLSAGMQKAASVSEQAFSTIQAGSKNIAANIAPPVIDTKNFPMPKVDVQAMAYDDMYQRVHGGMQKAVDGVKGVTEKVKGGFGSIKEFGSRMWDSATTAVKGIGKWGDSLGKHKETMRHARGAVMDMLGSTAIMETVQNATGISTEIWSAAQEVLNIVMSANPIGIVVMAIVGLVLWIKHIIAHNKYWGEAMKALWEIIKSWAFAQWTIWKMVGETIWYWIQYAWLKIKGFVEYTIEAMTRVGQSIKLALSGDFSGASAIWDKPIITKASLELEAVTKAHETKQQGYKNDIAEASESIMKNLGVVGSKIIEGIDKRKEEGTDPTKTKETADEAAETKKAATGATPHHEGRQGFSSDHSREMRTAGNEVTSGGSRSIIINIKELGNNFTQNNYQGNPDFSQAGKNYKEELIRMLSSLSHY